MSKKSAGDKLTRNRPVEPGKTAFLVVDVQNYCVHPGQGEWSEMDADNIPAHMNYYFDRVWKKVVPNIQRLQKSFRSMGAEVMFTVIESLTYDGRERGLDYKISGLFVPKGSPLAEMPVAIAPIGDEMVIRKGSSGVFNSTNIDYLLRSLGVDYLVIAGLVTDQCVETAVRDACDRGYLVTLVTDACSTYSEAREAASLEGIRGYCRQMITDDLCRELDGFTAA